MFMSFRQRALTILSPSTKKKLSDWTRKQMLQKPQKSEADFRWFAGKTHWLFPDENINDKLSVKSILISCRPLLTSALMFLTWSLPLFTQDLSSHVQNQRLMTKWFQSFLNPTIFFKPALWRAGVYRLRIRKDHWNLQSSDPTDVSVWYLSYLLWLH